MRISVCVTSSPAERPLKDLIHALRWSHRPPCEVVVSSRTCRLDLPETSFPVRQLVLGSGINHWQARNRAANAARGDLLIFLENGCLAHPELIDRYAEAARLAGGAFGGEVRTLPEGAARRGIDFSLFKRLAPADEGEGASPAMQRIGALEFSVGNFAISAADFLRIGGFPETEGGRRETDAAFARALWGAHLPLWRVSGATAWCEQWRRRPVRPVQVSEPGLLVAKDRPVRVPLVPSLTSKSSGRTAAPHRV
ncbi:hypothetical protein [Altericroceibacterium xinjiangense]|uniref:hypothetical protein n=1 Tax=Altericroceibacterium xinjiangense TaxID=762261 RepID=UPI000F7E680E|nr:hypothetical protein [Altericroceibacterium xinjiangense]